MIKLFHNYFGTKPVVYRSVQNALVALNEGASDEKRMAMEALEGMLLSKVQTLLEYEKNANNTY